MKISIEEKSGFCFGVKRVIEIAESLLDRGEKIYCLGEIVHNEKEVKRLKDKGLIFIEHSDLDSLKDKTVLIRAHGEPPETYQRADQNNLKLIDGTCPIVAGIQKKIRKSYEQLDNRNEQIIIYGKEGHPEVRGLIGQTEGNALVVGSKDDFENADLKKKIYFFSQTTMDVSGFENICTHLMQDQIEKREVEVNNTICKHVSHREPGLRKFASQNELVIFVAGKKSSNGRILFEICQEENPETHFISEPGELKQEWFNKSWKTVGVCGATSTPVWLLKKVAEKIQIFTEN